jgi:pimeloyl-ACP methyl ester carboxylesterase
MGEAIDTGDIELWTERRGQGPDVLLIAGLGDPAEAWQPQLDGLSDRYLVTAFDNRGAGRTPLPEGRLSAATMADDAAALLRTLEVSSVHVAGFSMGSGIAQELALRHPERVRSLVLMSTYARPDALFRSQLNFWRWLAEVAPSEHAFFEAFFTWVYTPRARGRHGGSNRRGGAGLPPPAVRRGLSSASRRLPRARHGGPPSGDRRADTRPVRRARHYPAAALRRIGRSGHPERSLRGQPGEAHQPFQEVPDEFNARVEAFWRKVEARS